MRGIKSYGLLLIFGCVAIILSASVSLATDWYSTEYGGYWDYPSTWKDSAGNPPPDGEPGEGDSAFLVVPYMYSSPSSPIPTYVDYRSDTSPLLNQVIVESSTVLSQWQYPYGGGTPAVEQLYLRSNVERIGGSGLTFDPPPPDFGGPPPEIFPIGTHKQNAGTNSTGGLYIGGTEGSYGKYYLDNASDSIYGTLSVDSLEIIGSAGEGLFEQDGGVHEVGTALIMGMSETGTGTYQMTDGTLDAAVEIVGSSGYGEFNQSGGENTANQLVLGQHSGGEGVYNLSGTGILSVGTEIVGDEGKGTFNQSGGENTANHLVLGQNSGGEGVYNLSGTGILSVGTEIVGDEGKGTFNQNSGTHNADNLVMGKQDSSHLAIYSMTGGTLKVDDTMTVGEAGDARFSQQFAGSNVTTGILKIANGETSDSDYNFFDGSLRVLGSLNLGNMGNGDFTQFDGTVELGSGSGTALKIYSDNDSYSLRDGTLTVHGSEEISGQFGQIGGDHEVTPSANSISNKMYIGIDNKVGTYNLVDGTLTAPYIVIGSGGSSRGVFNQTGADSLVKVTYLDVGFSEPSSGVVSNIYQLTDGTLQVGSDLNPGLLNIGMAGSGIGDNLNVDGGKLEVVGDEKIGIYDYGTLKQTAGVHKVDGTLNIGDGYIGIYNQSGGTLTVNGTENVGQGADGYFLHYDGSHVVNSGELVIGDLSGATGYYNLGEVSGSDAPTLTVNGIEKIGRKGEGNFNHYEGTHTVNGQLILGYESGGVGNYTLTGSSLVKNTVNGELILGYETGSTGVYTQTGGSLSVSNDETIGYEGKGTFNQSGGTHIVSGALYVGGDDDGTKGTGTYNLSGGGEAYANALLLGYSGGNGTFSQTGGTLEVFGHETIGGSDGIATFTQSGGTNSAVSLSLGNLENANASYTLTDTGQLNLTGNMYINDLGGYDWPHSWGKGKFIQDSPNSQVDIEGKIFINAQLSSAGYELKRGTLYSGGVDLAGTKAEYGMLMSDPIGETEIWKSSFWQEGGEHIVDGDVFIHSAQSVKVIDNLRYLSGRGATYWLIGGTLTADEILIGNKLAYWAWPSQGSLEVWSDGSKSATEIHVNEHSLKNEGLTTFNGSGTSIVTGRVENSGEMTTTGTNVVFNGSFINSGQFNSQDSNVQFNQLVVEPTGYMTGNGGDVFSVSGDFMNGSLEKTLWETSETSLIFNGSGVQNFSLAGMDMGATALGYENNFAWGELFLGSDVILTLLDGNELEGAALYIGLLGFEEPIINIGELLFDSISSIFNIYYNPLLAGNDYLGRQMFALAGGGYLIPTEYDTPPTEPVPEPSTIILLGCGLAGLVFVVRRRKKE